MIRIFLLLIAVASGSTAIWMFAVRPPPSEPVVTSAPVATKTEQTNNTTEPVATSQTDEKVEVLVASQAFPASHVLTKESIQWEALNASEAPNDSFTRSEMSAGLNEIIGKVYLNPMDEGAVLRQSHVQGGVLKARADNLSRLLEPGKRAISIVVSEEVMAGGFILPNDHVDVIHVQELENNTTRSRILARNVKVIALDQNTSEMIEGSNYISRTATLKVDAEDVIPITSAQSSGRLILALRSASDNDDSRPVSQKQNDAGASQPSAVRIIRNGQIETITVPK